MSGFQQRLLTLFPDRFGVLQRPVKVTFPGIFRPDADPVIG